MKAAYIEQTGPPENIKVGDLPRPEPGPGQVLVKVRAVALNPIDLYIRSGMVAFPLAFPYIIACDLAGTVEQVGPDCKRLKVGDRVWGSNQGLLGRQGVASEFAAVGEEWLYPTPALLPDEQAAAMALVGITAHLGLFRFGRLKSGETAYVPGGSGGVGSMAVQMAKAAGRGSQPRPAAPSASNSARPSAPIWLSTTRPTTFPPDFASSPPKASTSGTRPGASRTSRSPSPCSASTAG